MTDAQILQLFGLVYLATGLGALINPRNFHKILDELMGSRLAIFFGACMAVTLGFLLIIFHNTWAMEWNVLITIIGWISLLKGLVMLIHPKLIKKLGKVFLPKRKNVAWPAALILASGALMAVLGFFVV